MHIAPFGILKDMQNIHRRWTDFGRTGYPWSSVGTGGGAAQYSVASGKHNN